LKCVDSLDGIVQINHIHYKSSAPKVISLVYDRSRRIFRLWSSGVWHNVVLYVPQILLAGCVLMLRMPYCSVKLHY